MSNSKYKSAPVAQEGMPGGIPYIIGNEAAERFSYYGMKTILIVFMTRYLLDSGGGFDVMSAEEAKSWYHLFGSAVYFFPILGALISDAFLGKYKTILSLSVVYCLGHLALALDETRMGLSLGLALIAIGSGGIKPCVSAHVGDQFGPRNQHLLEKVFEWFYFSINLGAAISTLATPWLLDKYGPHVAFGIPGALMLLATIVFWMGRNSFVHIPSHGMGFVKEAFSGEGLKVVGRLSVLYAFVAMFWALFDQTGSAWVLQAERMDLEVFGFTLLPSQIQAVNPFLIMMMIPLFSYVIYPGINRFFPLNPLRKIGIGFFITVPAFLLPAWIETRIAAGESPSIGWQVIAYVIITAAEVFVSITSLEFSYTQAPKKMKSFIMGIFLMSVSMGNLFTSAVNVIIQESTPMGELAIEGSKEVKLDRSTTWALSCEDDKGGADGAEASAEVAVAPVKRAEEAPKADPNAVALTTFTANGVKGEPLIVAPGTEVEFVWAAERATECRLSPDGSVVAATGSKKVTPEATTTFVFSCEGASESSAEERIKVVVTDGVAIRSFSVDKARLDPPGGVATLTWKAERATKCSLTAQTVRLDGPSYYLFFAGAMFLTALGFLGIARTFPIRNYIQDADDATPEP
jgi:POT family proton-dependent oligopeptide transporter